MLRFRPRVPVRLCSTVLAATVTAALCTVPAAFGAPAAATAAPARTTSTAPHAAVLAARTASRKSLPASTASTASVSRTAAACADIKALTKSLGRRGMSVAALNLDRAGAPTFTCGATSGMRVGSIIKLLILEELMHKRTSADRWLSSYERGQARLMIEYSDNDAAYRLYKIVGGKPALQAMARRLHLAHTSIDGHHFGLSTTSAADFVKIWHAVLDHPSVVNLRSRKYARDLTSHVVGWQRWGIGAAAQGSGRTYNKNGWLSVDADSGRWLVNSTGMTHVNGKRLLLVVLTQHGASFSGGIKRVEKISRLAARAVR